MSNTDWNVTKSIMVEVEQLFSRDDDVRDIRDVKKMSREIEHIYQTNFKDAKEIIKGAMEPLTVKENKRSKHPNVNQSYILFHTFFVSYDCASCGQGGRGGRPFPGKSDNRSGFPTINLGNIN